MRRISLLLPAYNEAESLEYTFRALQALMDGALSAFEVEVIFINDGSTDRTQYILEQQNLLDSRFKYIELSRNFGHQLALRAGLDQATGDAVISLDADLQHPPDLIPRMLELWQQGYEVIYTLRDYGTSVGLGKKKSSDTFYSLINFLSSIEIEKGASDFRLLDASVIRVVRNFREEDPFFRGIIKWIGFRQIAIPYTAGQRVAGSSKYTLRKMLRFALTGITAFSVKPLYLASYLGFIFSAGSLLYIPYVLYAFWSGHEVSGWASVLMSIVFFGGVQLSILGIMGIYLGKVFRAIQARPSYIIRSQSL